MNTLRVLQLGDVHYPEAIKKGSAVDWKDSGFPKATGSVATPNPFQNVLRRIATVLDTDPQPDAILICGDLTDRGALSGYRDCLAHLNKSLKLSTKNADSLHTVPGNHDIDRKGLKPATTEAGIWKKFNKLSNEWKKLGMPILTVNNVRETSIKTPDGRGKLHIWSLNSCVGCGEYRNLPEALAKKLRPAIEAYAKTTGDDFKLLGEQLDTPAFDESSTAQITENLARLDTHDMAIILAHHNLLPQAKPRIAIYSEVLNSGMLRSALQNSLSPTIYCHGHIHDDPIEQTGRVRKENPNVTIISAPMLSEGFNLIDIMFSKTGKPLGCTVEEHRIDRSASIGISPKNVVRVPFRSPSDLDSPSTSAVAHIIRILKLKGPLYFNDLLKAVHRSKKPKIKTSTLQDALLESEWHGVLRISNRSEDPSRWQIERIVP